jgi:hypothetical protein
MMAYDSNAAEPLTQVREALAERDRLRAYVSKLEAFGGQLANCAHNLKYQDSITEHDKKCLSVAQEGWDKVRSDERQGRPL